MESERIEALAARCEAIADPALRSDVLELLRLVLELHGEGLAVMLQATAEAPHFEALLAAWRRAETVQALLELHGLPLPERAPVPEGDFVPLAALTL